MDREGRNWGRGGDGVNVGKGKIRGNKRRRKWTAGRVE